MRERNAIESPASRCLAARNLAADTFFQATVPFPTIRENILEGCVLPILRNGREELERRLTEDI